METTTRIIEPFSNILGPAIVMSFQEFASARWCPRGSEDVPFDRIFFTVDELLTPDMGLTVGGVDGSDDDFL